MKLRERLSDRDGYGASVRGLFPAPALGGLRRVRRSKAPNSQHTMGRSEWTAGRAPKRVQPRVKHQIIDQDLCPEYRIKLPHNSPPLGQTF